MQIGKIKSTAIAANRAGAEVLTCIVEIRKLETVTAEWINSLGESATPVIGDWIFITPRAQSIGGYLAFGFADVVNQIFADRGVKIVYGRDSAGIAKTRILLTDSEIIIENPENARIELSGENIVLNDGTGTAVEQARLQVALEQFSAVVLTEFAKVAAGTLPNPSAPYVPSPNLPVDTTPAKSETIKLP